MADKLDGAPLDVIDLGDEKFRDKPDVAIEAILAGMKSRAGCDPRIMDADVFEVLTNPELLNNVAVPLVYEMVDDGSIVVPERPEDMPCGVSLDEAVSRITADVIKWGRVNALPHKVAAIAKAIREKDSRYITEFVLGRLEELTDEEIMQIEDVLAHDPEHPKTRRFSGVEWRAYEATGLIDGYKSFAFLVASWRIKKLLVSQRVDESVNGFCTLVNTTNITNEDFERILSDDQVARRLKQVAISVQGCPAEDLAMIVDMVGGISPESLKNNNCFEALKTRHPWAFWGIKPNSDADLEFAQRRTPQLLDALGGPKNALKLPDTVAQYIILSSNDLPLERFIMAVRVYGVEFVVSKVDSPNSDVISSNLSLLGKCAAKDPLIPMELVALVDGENRTYADIDLVVKVLTGYSSQSAIVPDEKTYKSVLEFAQVYGTDFLDDGHFSNVAKLLEAGFSEKYLDYLVSNLTCEALAAYIDRISLPEFIGSITSDVEVRRAVNKILGNIAVPDLVALFRTGEANELSSDVPVSSE